jgi:hypothetical protein
MVAARRKGKWVGGCPVLGSDIDPGGGPLVVNEEEAERVRAIFELFEKHQSILATLGEIEQGVGLPRPASSHCSSRNVGMRAASGRSWRRYRAGYRRSMSSNGSGSSSPSFCQVFANSARATVTMNGRQNVKLERRGILGSNRSLQRRLSQPSRKTLRRHKDVTEVAHRLKQGIRSPLAGTHRLLKKASLRRSPCANIALTSHENTVSRPIIAKTRFQ